MILKSGNDIFISGQVNLNGQKFIKFLIDNKIIIPKKNDKLYIPENIIIDISGNFLNFKNSDKHIEFDFNNLEIPILNKIQQIQLQSNQKNVIENKSRKRGLI